MPEPWLAAPQIFGGAMALLSAAAWALGSVLFGRLGEEVSEAGMNLFKCLVGTLLLGAALVATGAPPLDGQTISYLVVSGVIGIAIGDTLFFGALVRLGPKLTLIVSNVGPAFTVILAVSLLGERLSGVGAAGMALTLAGATLVSWRRAGPACGPRASRGILWALGAALSTAVAVVLAKVGVREISALEGTTVRVFAGGVALGLLGAVRGTLGTWLGPLRRPRTLWFALGAVFVSMSGFWLFLLGLKYGDASGVSVLNSTTPLFVLPIAAMASRERIAASEVAGALMGTVGVAMIFVGQ